MSFLEVKNLKKYFFSENKLVHAVDGVSFVVKKGETIGLVGESGCGKTTLGKTILRLFEPTDGEIYLEGQNLLKLNKKEMRNVRKGMQLVFQDPIGSLNPRMTIETIIGRPLEIYNVAHGNQKRRIVSGLLAQVGLNPDHIDRYPHEFSGGQRQRIAIARAIALKPSFVVLDEPTSSLDVSVQAQILNLLKELQYDFDLTYLFISHNLHVTHFMSDRIGVMYLGKLVEMASAKEIFDDSQHPYTKALISAIPTADPEVRNRRIILSGDVPSPIDPPSGCRFCPRCFSKEKKCEKEEPKLIKAEKNHLVACHLL